MAGGGEVHTCSDTSLALAAKQKQTLSGEASRLLPAPRASRAPWGAKVLPGWDGAGGAMCPGLAPTPPVPARWSARSPELPADGSEAVAAFPILLPLLFFLLSPIRTSSSPPRARPAPRGFIQVQQRGFGKARLPRGPGKGTRRRGSVLQSVR